MNASGFKSISRKRLHLPFLKGGQELFWPFRLSTTSCIIPESILANLLFLGPYLDEVELVFFETRTETNFPSHQDIRSMRQVAEDLDITFNLHLPGDWEMISSHLADYTGGLSIEIFSMDDLAASLDRLRTTLRDKVPTSHLHPGLEQCQLWLK